MRSFLSAAAFAVLFASGAQAATTGSILAQGSDGNIYQVSTADASVSLFKTLSDIPGIEPNSPNGLGVNRFSDDIMFRTSYNGPTEANFLFRNDEQLIEIPGARQSVASGHVIGDTFYYMDREGVFYSVDGIFGAAGTQTISAGVKVPGADLTYGDIVIKDDTAYISTGNIFASFDVADPAAGFTDVFTPSVLFAGLAFDGLNLYGFTANGNSLTNELFSISLASGSFGLATFIGEIIIDGVMLTDAAPTPVPLPAAGLMLMGSLAGLALLRRRKAQVA